MKIAIAALCVLALTGSANADFVINGEIRAPCRGIPAAPPPTAQQEPTVIYIAIKFPFATIQKLCAGGAKLYHPITACTARISDDEWNIFMPDYLSDRDYACTLLYEKAHLAPNNWVDQKWEDHAFKGTPY